MLGGLGFEFSASGFFKKWVFRALCFLVTMASAASALVTSTVFLRLSYSTFAEEMI